MERKIKNIFIEGAIPATRISDSLQAHAARTNIGAHAVFVGQVRADVREEGVVTAIEYSAYEEMALEKMAEIREAVFDKYQLTCMHVVHSLGKVHAGGICLFVFTSSPKRRAALEACDETVERIKAELPVWGKEMLGDQKHIWKENTN